MSDGNFATRAIIPTIAPSIAKGITKDKIADGKLSPKAETIDPRSVMVWVIVATSGIYDVIRILYKTLFINE